MARHALHGWLRQIQCEGGARLGVGALSLNADDHAIWRAEEECDRVDRSWLTNAEKFSDQA
jgi:hypothetical protein